MLFVSDSVPQKQRIPYFFVLWNMAVGRRVTWPEKRFYVLQVKMKNYVQCC